MTTVQIPAVAVATEGSTATDLAVPTADLLRSLNLLPTPEELQKAGHISTAVTGTPDSVAVLEAGATALAKVWAGGLGATVIAAWVAIRAFYVGQPDPNQRIILLGAALVTVAALLGIAYIVGSDIRGRAAASVATVEVRGKIATAMIAAAEQLYEPKPAAPGVSYLQLSPPPDIEFQTKPATEETGWRAIAMIIAGSDIKYVVVKQGITEITSADSVSFV